MELIQHIEHASVLPLKDQIQYQSGRVVSVTLAKQTGVGITLFAFDEGEGLSTHAAGGDAMAIILEGSVQIIIDSQIHELNAGDCIVMPVGIPHALKAITRFKMLLVVVFPV